MLKREDWLGLARELDWELSYAQPREVFPSAVSGRRESAAIGFDASAVDPGTGERHHSYGTQADELARATDRVVTSEAWDSALKLRAATLANTEFASAIGSLRTARFAHFAVWRATSSLTALAALRRAQSSLASLSRRADADPQLDWTRRFFHTDQWTAIATRHFVDELLLASDPTELAVGNGFVFETAFRGPQLAHLASLARASGDAAHQDLLNGLVAESSRQAQLARAVVAHLVVDDRPYAQHLVDKWFWRSWQLFALESGAAIDYLTPLSRRAVSFGEFVQESIAEPFAHELARVGLELPWYWPKFIEACEIQHHMLYASLYTYRRTMWFDPVLPGPDERAWLHRKYPRTFHLLDPIWSCIAERWRVGGTGVEWYAHGTSPPAVCSLCQLLLCGGTPRHNYAQARDYGGRNRIFCSEPCAWIFEREPWRYAAHRDLGARIRAGSVPGNLLELITRSFGLGAGTWGSDARGGDYSWLGSEAP